jgi:hypothetical protein
MRYFEGVRNCILIEIGVTILVALIVRAMT